jgi:butyrate kinase
MMTRRTPPATLAKTPERSPAAAAGPERVVAFRILAIDPGSTSTKLAIVRTPQAPAVADAPAEIEARTSIPVTPEHPADYAGRLRAVTDWLATQDAQSAALDAVVGRGGLLRPIPGGTYAVCDAMAADLRVGVRGDHPANLGGLLARAIADAAGVPAFVVDPVATDEFAPVSRVAGLADLRRVSLLHALNVRAVARRDCAAHGRVLDQANLVVAHLGGGISVVAIERGRMVDANNAHEEGPFSPERCGGLPSGQVAELVHSGRLPDTDAARTFLHRTGGVRAYLGTSDLVEVERRVAAGDAHARAVLDAMAYQIGKSIGAYAASLAGNVDAVLLTGGAAHCAPLVAAITPLVDWIAPVRVYPGEDELSALAEGAARVLNGLEAARDYASSILTDDQEPR